MASFKEVAAHLQSLFDSSSSSSQGASFAHLTLPAATASLVEQHLAAAATQPHSESAAKKWSELLVDVASKLPPPADQYPATDAFVVLLDVVAASSPATWPDPRHDLLRHFWARLLLPLLEKPPLGRDSFAAARRLLITTATADPATVTSALWDSFSTSTLAEEALRGWAKAHPRDAFLQIARRADCRALTFLTYLMRDAPHLAHHAVSTPLLHTLARLVSESRRRQAPQARRNTHDTADLACGAFALLIPRISSLLDTTEGIGLFSLFAVFARAACWGHISHDVAQACSGYVKLGGGDQAATTGFIGPYAVDAETSPSPTSADTMENVATALGEALAELDNADESWIESQKPLSNCGALFTVLYGLWPCSFMDFLKAPGLSVNTIDWDGEVEVLQRRIQPFLKTHRLSAGLIKYSDAAAERRDKARLNALEAADMLAEIQQHVLPDPSTPADDMERGRHRYSPLQIPESNSIMFDQQNHHHHAAILETYVALKSNVARGVSVSSRMTTNESAVGVSAAEFNDTVERLKRENLVLKNELCFELYLKSQHLQQLGTLHKEHILESGLEAEVQALQAINRALHRKLDGITRKDEQLREATAQRNANHVQYTDSIRDRSARYRDEKKSWIEDRSKMKASLEDRDKRIESLAKELNSTGQLLTDTRYEMEALQPKLDSISSLEQKNHDLTQSLLVWDDDLRRFRDQKRQMDSMTAEWQKMQMLQSSGESENDSLRQALRQTEEQVRKLEAEIEASKRKSLAEMNMQDRSEMTYAMKFGKLKEEFEGVRRECEEVRRRNLELEERE